MEGACLTCSLPLEAQEDKINIWHAHKDLPLQGDFVNINYAIPILCTNNESNVSLIFE